MMDGETRDFYEFRLSGFPTSIGRPISGMNAIHSFILLDTHVCHQFLTPTTTTSQTHYYLKKNTTFHFSLLRSSTPNDLSKPQP
jgi:hypothetical protein